MESGKKTLEQLTTAGVFHVPDYQRYYSWEKSEWDDLWTDLYTLPQNKQHYFGTVIIQETTITETGGSESGYGGTAEKPINLLIDGQQRLTSLVLLVKSMTECLVEIAPETDHDEDIREDVKEMRQKLLIEDNIHRLDLLDKKDNQVLDRIIEGRKLREPDRPSQDKMIRAKKYFKGKLDDLASSEGLEPIDVANRISRIWRTILQLELMVYVVKAERPEKATLIFDSVNDRGRSLSTFDKTKSFLMRMAYLAAEDDNAAQGTIRRIRQAFGEMYSDHQKMLNSPYVSDIADDDVQRYHFISYFDWSDSDQHSDPTFLTELKTRIRNLRLEDPEACLKYIENYTENLETGFEALADILGHRDDGEMKDLIDRIHKLRHATKFYPLLLKAWPNLEDDEQIELLDAIETFIFRTYSIGNHKSHTGESSLNRAARDIDDDYDLEIWNSRIVGIMNENDAEFRRSLGAQDLYSKLTTRDIRYLFYFYNEERAKEKKERGGPTLDEAMYEYTIEHIWPKTPDEMPIEEAGDYPSPEARYDANKHRLGNLTLASSSWNAEWGNRSFERKHAEGYSESKLWVQWDIQDQYDEWSIENINDLEGKIIEFALGHWPTPDTRFDDIERPSEAIDSLTEKELFVLHALCQNSGGAVRRVIHKEVSDIPSSPFENPESSGNERSLVGSILSRLQGVGLAERDKHTWYPTEDALSAEMSHPS